MDAKQIFWFTFLVIQASCEQKKSLTFVIDNSYSMTDDISYVRKGAKSIIDIVLNEQSSQIEDIVLVTFDDPGWEFRKRTRSEKELKKAIDDIKIGGNYDCPEKCLSGLKMGLEESLPGSFIYVFTDASAKDYYMFEEIKNLCQEKQIQIVFVLTGQCGSLTGPKSKVYYKIAAASNGQVFRINKEEIEQVLKYVRETIKGDRTVITSTVVHPNVWSDSYVYFNIDDKTEYALVSSSGSHVTLMVSKDGSRIPGIRVTWTENVKVLKLVGITPGLYRAAVRGSSDVNVMVFGRTDFNFEFGFSNNKQSSLKYTETQPTIGSETHLIISVKDDEHSVNIENVEILDMNEMVIQRLPLTNVGSNVYRTDKFLPPNVMFKVAVTATARSTGNPIRRIANTPVEPIKPVTVAPEITHTENYIEAIEYSKVNIHCRIRKGKPKPHVKWYFRQRGAKQFQLLSGRTDDVLIISKVAEGDAGEYQCVAVNIAGQAAHVVQLQVFGLPAFEKSPSVLEVRQSANQDIQCKISKGNPLPAITWQFKTSETGEFHNIDNFGEHLKIFNTQLSNSGFYKCVAKNKVGTAQQVTQVIVLVNPEFENTPAKITEKENAAVILKCKLRKGNPRPRITWYFQAGGSATFTSLRNSGVELRLPAVQLKDEGEYKCVAENSAGRDEKTIRVTVLVAPAISDTEKLLKAKEGEAVNIHCRIQRGKPKPHVTWYFRQRGANQFKLLTGKTDDVLLMSNVLVGDTGEYQCVAENIAGRATHIVQLEVFGLPAFEKSPSVLEIRQSANLDIQCKISKGNPLPAITWQFKTSETGEFHNIDNFKEHLRINNVQVSNSGFYKCEAKNAVGTAQQVIQVIVLVNPEFEDTPGKITEKENATVTLKCILRKGNPRPRITWYVKASGSDTFTALRNSGEELRLPAVQLKDSGEYRCVAENSAGRNERTMLVTVLVAPEIKDTEKLLKAKNGEAVNIHCRLRKGNPRPRITWYFQASGSATFTALGKSGEDLRLPAVQLKDSGEYRCVAENSAGRDERTVLVTVLAAPEIERSTPSIIRVKENATISIPCRVSLGFPKPIVTWWYMNATSTEYTAIPDSNAEYLHLEQIQLSKAGHYKCVAQNVVGQTDKDVQVIVEAPARIVFIPPNSPFYDGVVGDVVMRLPCTAVGFPKPSVSWIVDQVVVGKDKSRSLYVEYDVLYLKNPQEMNSSYYTFKNISHTYVCHAVNDFGADNKSYEVTVSEFADYENNNTDEKYPEAKKPYVINCPLVYTDPNSVRWFYNSIPMNKTGPSLHFDDPTQANNGNYTCRVSDLNGAASYTVGLTFDYHLPPSASKLVYEVEWNGNEDEITCKANIDSGKYEWFYRGEKVKEADTDQLGLSLMGWGQYVCRVTNPFGTLNITYNIHAKDCIVERNLSKTLNMPLLLDMSFSWANFRRQNQNQIIPKSEKLTFICQDELSKNRSNSESFSNSFTRFPNTKSITATCDHEYLFLVDGVSYKISELDCKDNVSSSVVPINECLGSDTMMMSVGFNVNGFLDVYRSCLDTKRNVVLYTEVIMPYADSLEYTNEPERPCESVAECCYESVQLVNAADVAAGPAEKATMRKHLNTVSYCKPNDKNVTSWHNIEMEVRKMSASYPLIVWSGAANYTTVDKLLVPQYLWKVVKNLDNEDIIAIVHSNEQVPKASVCESVCQESTWFESYGSRTYCCKLDEFKKVFNLTINF